MIVSEDSCTYVDGLSGGRGGFREGESLARGRAEIDAKFREWLERS